MKTRLSFLAAFIFSLTAFGQGRVSFWNDNLHMYYFSEKPYPALVGADLAYGGTPLTSPTPSGRNMVVDLYAGTSSSSLSFIVSTPMSGSNPGLQPLVNVTLPGIPGGVPAYFQIQIRDSQFANAISSITAGSYAGYSEVFTCIPSSSPISYNSLWNHGGTAQSTWADGTFNLDAFGVGNRGAIFVGTDYAWVPEPSAYSFLLVGLGCTFTVCRRKQA